MNRRTFIKGMLASAVVVAAGIDLLKAPKVMRGFSPYASPGKTTMMNAEMYRNIFRGRLPYNKEPDDIRIVGFWKMDFNDEAESV